MRCLIIVLTAILFSCSPSKYEAISVAKGTPPLTTKDSNYLAGRCAATFPIPDTFKPIVLPTVPDSSKYFKSKSDSLASLKPKVIDRLKIEYKDTCTSAVNQYEDGFKDGEKMGYYDGKTDAEVKFNKLLNQKDIDCNRHLSNSIQSYLYKIGEAETANNLLKQSNKEKDATIAQLNKKISNKNTELWVHRLIWLIVLIWLGIRIWKNLTTIKIK